MIGIQVRIVLFNNKLIPFINLLLTIATSENIALPMLKTRSSTTLLASRANMHNNSLAIKLQLSKKRQMQQRFICFFNFRKES